MAPMRIGSWAKAVPTPRAPTATSTALYFMFVSSRFDHARFEHEPRHADLDPRRVRWQRETHKAYADYLHRARTHLVLEKDSRLERTRRSITRRDNRRWPRRSGGDPSPIWIIVLGRTTSGTAVVTSTAA